MTMPEDTRVYFVEICWDEKTGATLFGSINDEDADWWPVIGTDERVEHVALRRLDELPFVSAGSWRPWMGRLRTQRRAEGERANLKKHRGN